MPCPEKSSIGLSFIAVYLDSTSISAHPLNIWDSIHTEWMKWGLFVISSCCVCIQCTAGHPSCEWLSSEPRNCPFGVFSYVPLRKDHPIWACLHYTTSGRGEEDCKTLIWVSRPSTTYCMKFCLNWTWPCWGARVYINEGGLECSL